MGLRICLIMVVSALMIMLLASGAAAASIQIQLDDVTTPSKNVDSFQFNVTPDLGYETVEIFVDDVLVGAYSNYSLSDILSGSHTIRVGFLGVPVISGPKILMAKSVGTFSVNSAKSEFIEIDFGDSSGKVRYNATNGKIVVNHRYSSAGSYNVTAAALTGNKTAGSSEKMTVEVKSMSPSSEPSVNNTVVSILNSNVTSIVQFAVNKSDITNSGLTPIYSAKEESLPSGYAALPDNKAVIAILNISTVNVNPTLSNLSTFTIQIDDDIFDGVLHVKTNEVIVYRYTQSDNSFIPVPLVTKYNSSANDNSVYGFDVETPGYSYFAVTAASETSGIASPDEENTGGTNNVVKPLTKIPTQRPIYYTTVEVTSGSFEYTTTMDNKKFVVDYMTPFGVLYASGKTLETKEWPGGIYVNSIDYLAQDENLNGWLYQVNGEALSVMSNNYKLNDGDKVVWYYSDSMDSKPETSRVVYYFVVKEKVVTLTPTPTPTPAPIVVLTPAKSSDISLTLPDGVSISSRGDVNTLKIDTSKTNKLGNVDVKGDKSIVITSPGLQITFAVSEIKKINSGTESNPVTTLTAEIEGMSIETLHAPTKVNVYGTVI